jgi:uncharacterized membrane protein YccC
MLVIGGFLIGAVFGPFRAGNRGGARLDKLHYSAAYALIGTLIGLFATIVIDRLI